MSNKASSALAVRVHCGHALDVLEQLDADSVQCCVTGPPGWDTEVYFSHGQLWGGWPGCEHAFDAMQDRGAACRLCGAWQGLLGREPELWLYVRHIVAVFRAVRRVLRPSGVMWLHLPDWYAQQPSAVVREHCKPRDLIGVPWAVAQALRTDGWWWRATVIWQWSDKAAIRPSDRPAQTHEYFCLFSKEAEYYYNQEDDALPSVWTTPVPPYRGELFEPFSHEVVRRCVLTGSAEGDLILDPFCGTGTVGAVSLALGRRFVGIDLHPGNVSLALSRMMGLTPTTEAARARSGD